MNIFSFEYGDLSGDGHDERDIVWLKTDLTKEEFEQCLDGIKSELGFDFDDNIFAAGEDDILPVELIDYLKENKFDLIENILQGQTDNVHFIIDFFLTGFKKMKNTKTIDDLVSIYIYLNPLTIANKIPHRD